MGKKQIWVVLGLVALLVVTGYLNYRLNAPKTDETADSDILSPADTEENASTDKGGDTVQAGTKTAGSFFSEFRQERTSVREQEVAYFDSVITNDKTDSETLKEAQAQKLKLTAAMEKELIIEGMLKAKGFSDVVVTVNTGSVNVVVDQAELSESEIAQVLELVSRESNEALDNIKIVPTN